jgi:hypothetical protein
VLGTVVRVNVRKIVGFLAIALVIFFVVTQPSGAANMVGNIIAFLGTAADSLVSFFSQITS